MSFFSMYPEIEDIDRVVICSVAKDGDLFFDQVREWLSIYEVVVFDPIEAFTFDLKEFSFETNWSSGFLV